MRLKTTALSLGLMILATLLASAGPASALTSVPDGTTWMANGFVKASVQYGNVMFIGGDFSKLGESVFPGPNSGPFVDGYTGLAAIDMTTGQAIANFKPRLTANANQTLTVFALEMVGNRLFVGGQFSTVNGENHYNLAALDINPVTFRDTVVSTFDTVVGIPGNSNEGTFEVRTILAGPDGLYVGGAFSKVDGKGRPKTAKLEFDGSLVNAYKTAGVDGIVHDMVWAADAQSIFLAGGFKQLGIGNPRYALGRIDPTSGATLPWAVPSSQIPGATTTGQTCYELATTTTRLFAGCGKKPNFVGAFRLDAGDVGTRTWQYGTGGNVQTVHLLPNGDDLVIGGHLGINSSQTYNGLMRVCNNTKYLRAIAILRNVTSTTSMVSPITTGSTSVTQPYLDCNFLPNIDGVNPQGPNYSGVNRYGGLWEIQVTDDHLWALGEFRYVNSQVRRSIARFSWTGLPPVDPPPPTQPVLTELTTPSPFEVQSDRTLSFTLRCPDQPASCNGSVKLIAGGSKQFGPVTFALAPLEDRTFDVILNDGAWDTIQAKSNHQIGGKLQLTAEGSPDTTPLSSSISVTLRLAA
ncbi:MAG: hypothetical protein OEW46_01130 [Actinomycetota bacterium]|nr:hypothetical protein [Actinomycetota bacterium]